MRRREFLCGAITAALPPAALAQESPRKIGFVSWFAPALAVHADQFRKGMRDVGYAEGRDVVIESYFTDGDRERTREVVRKLVQGNVRVLVIEATPAIAVAKQEAPLVPIVMAAVSDPIAAGFAQTLSRPGGNLTGRTMFGPDLAGKRIELLQEIQPSLRTVAFLGSSMDPNTITFVRATQAGTDQSGLKLIVQPVEGPKAIDATVFDAMKRNGAEAVIVQPIFAGHQARIVSLANGAGLPVIADWAMFAEAGAVLTYGIDDLAQMRRAAYFVDRILKGSSPGELPIEQPTETRLAVNVGAARRFGWTIPTTLIARADDVIE
jgi:putative ABC transport system substrate-binding protein